MDGLDAATDRFLRALAHSFQPLGDLLGGGRGGVHRALAASAPLEASAYICAKIWFISARRASWRLVAWQWCPEVKMAAKTSQR